MANATATGILPMCGPDRPLAPREDHAAYIGHWLDGLKANTHAIFVAASLRSARRTSSMACNRQRAPNSTVAL
jgi:hypothetical protein